MTSDGTHHSGPAAPIAPLEPPRAGGAMAVILFGLGPLLLVALAVGLRAMGRVSATPSVEHRVRTWLPLVEEAAAEHQLPIALILAVISQESGGRANAVSPQGAVGLMQLMPGTASDMAKREGPERPDRYDAKTSVALGTRYLAEQIERFDGRTDLALAAYNAGPAKVRSWMKERPAPSDPKAFLTWVRFGETRTYVRRVLAWRERWERSLAEGDGD